MKYSAIPYLGTVLIAMVFGESVQAAQPLCTGKNKDPSCNNAAAAFSGSINSFVTNRNEEKFVITSDSALDSVTNVTLGGVSVPTVYNATTFNLEIPFGTETNFITGASNLELTVDSVTPGMVYVDGRIPTPSNVCSCATAWNTSLNGAQGTCEGVTDGTQTSVSAYVNDGTNDYFITSAFDPGPLNEKNSFCAISVVDPTTLQPTIIQQNPIGKSEHDACAALMQSTYCNAP